MTAHTDDDLLRALAEARALGFLGPGDLEDQVRHADGFVAAVASGVSPALDLGSGGGLPGLVLALRLPQWEWVLVDAMRRRTSFLSRVVVSLGLSDRVRVVRGRAEELAHDATFRSTFGVVTARGFGPPALTAECAAGFLRVGGRLVVSDPPGSSGRWREREGLMELGLRVAARVPEPVALSVLEQVTPCPDHYPRAARQLVRSPLF